MKTKSFLTTAVAASLAAVGFIATSQEVRATPINGVIGFSGVVTLNGSTINASTEALSWGANTVGIASGSFAGLEGQSVALNSPWFFNSGALNNFWTVNGYTYNLSSSKILDESGISVTVILVGTVTHVGFDPTWFTGSFTTQDPGANSGNVTKYTESMSFGAPVPDKTATLPLLGASMFGLLALKGVRKKFQPQG